VCFQRHVTAHHFRTPESAVITDCTERNWKLRYLVGRTWRNGHILKDVKYGGWFERWHTQIHAYVHTYIHTHTYENNQKDALYRLIYYSKSALHVLGDVFAHHQEHLTVFTVSGSVHPSCCRVVPALPDTVNTIKCSWWWAKTSQLHYFYSWF